TAVKLAAGTGAELWRRSFTGNLVGFGEEGVFDLAIDASGDVVAVGQLWVVPGAGEIRAAELARDTGPVGWRQAINGGRNAFSLDGANAVAIDAAGDVVLGGQLQDAWRGLGDSDFVVMKLAGSDGHELWRMTIAGSGGMGELCTRIVVDPAGNVV